MKSKASSYFFGKKVTKKHLLSVGSGPAGATAHRKSEFFLVLFCSQKSTASFP
jgi:hypothetical protein